MLSSSVTAYCDGTNNQNCLWSAKVSVDSRFAGVPGVDVGYVVARLEHEGWRLTIEPSDGDPANFGTYRTTCPLCDGKRYLAFPPHMATGGAVA